MAGDKRANPAWIKMGSCKHLQQGQLRIGNANAEPLRSNIQSVFGDQPEGNLGGQMRETVHGERGERRRNQDPGHSEPCPPFQVR